MLSSKSYDESVFLIRVSIGIEIDVLTSSGCSSWHHGSTGMSFYIKIVNISVQFKLITHASTNWANSNVHCSIY